MRASVGGLLRRRLCSAAQRAAERAPTESASSRRAGLALFGGAAGTTAGLCSWQLQRYQWKVDLIESRGVVPFKPRSRLDYLRLLPRSNLERGARSVSSRGFRALFVSVM